jgi:hypothetical protein
MIKPPTLCTLRFPDDEKNELVITIDGRSMVYSITEGQLHNLVYAGTQRLLRLRQIAEMRKR